MTITTTKSFVRTLTTAPIALATLVPRFSAQAKPSNDDTPQVEVSIKTFDLTTDDGVAALTRSVRRAADAVCVLHGTDDLSAELSRQSCLKTAMADANAQVARLVAKARANHETKTAAAETDAMLPGPSQR